jgi:serpin B
VDKLYTEETRVKINKWISKNTSGMIPEFFKEKLDANVIMVLINALYFEASWGKAFKDQQTSKQAFKNIDGSTKQVDLMFKNDQLEYFEDETFCYVKLPYKGLDVKMVLALPKKESDTGVLPNTDVVMSPSKYKFKKRSVNIFLPKFKIESGHGLTKLLKTFGLGEIFSESAIGQKIILNDQAVVSDIIQ